jgi:hypothetical protein
MEAILILAVAFLNPSLNMKLNVFCMILAVMLVSLIFRFVQPLQTGEYIVIGSLVVAFSICFFNTVERPRKGKKGSSYHKHYSLDKRRLN